MIDDSGTDKVKLEDLKKGMKTEPKEGFSKDEIDSIADLISDGGSQTDFTLSSNDDDTGRFTR
jgi:hypothetical protein